MEKLIDELILEYKTDPVDLLGIGDAEGEYGYLTRHRNNYITTIKDILRPFEAKDTKSLKVLEIGCFLGLTSIVLSELGFKVTATDIKEFISCENLQKKLNRHRVEYVECDLGSYSLPFGDEQFDAVIMCEVLEHLNFNPLPVIKEVNRVLKQDGLLYLTVPNAASAYNRRQLLEGKSFHNPIQDYFDQLDPHINSIVGIHWREYTTGEVREMLEKLDFEVTGQRYDSAPPRKGLILNIKRLIRFFLNLKIVKRVIYSCTLDPNLDPSLNRNQINFALKRKPSRKEFHFTDITSPR